MQRNARIYSQDEKAVFPDALLTSRAISAADDHTGGAVGKIGVREISLRWTMKER